MPTTHLSRTRGQRSELRLPSTSRRPCRPPGPELGDPRGGRSIVVLERLDVDTAALRLAGELDVAALPALDAALRRAERWAPASLVVDVTDVAFIDLSAVGRLAAGHERLEARGGGLVAVNPPECMLRVLELLDDLELPVLT